MTNPADIVHLPWLFFFKNKSIVWLLKDTLTKFLEFFANYKKNENNFEQIEWFIPELFGYHDHIVYQNKDIQFFLFFKKCFIQYSMDRTNIFL